MVAGGVGLAPFADAGRGAARARRRDDALLRRAHAPAELFYLDFFRDLGVELVLTTEDGSAGERGRVVAPLDRAARRARPPSRRVMLYACGPEGMLAATREDGARSTAARARCRSSASWAAAWAAATAASSRCAATTAPFHHVRSCLAGPGAARRIRSLGLGSLTWISPFASAR